MAVDIENGLAIRVDGELGKFHTLPVDTLIDIGKNLQALVQSIVKAESGVSSSDLDNYKIELADFKPGSAIPVFKLTQRITPTITSVSGQRREVVNKLNAILDISDRETYNDIAHLYPLSKERDDILDNIYKFTNSFENAPVEFGSLKEGKFQKTFVLHKLSKKQKEKLISGVNKDEDDSNNIEKGLALIDIHTKGKKKRTTIKSIVKKTDNHSLSYSPDSITLDRRKYVLNYPLRCSYEIEDESIVIKNEFLDIYAVGSDEDEAKSDFAVEFDYLFRRLNELKDTEIGVALLKVKDFLKLYVRTVVEW
jgi:hypothetical protein